ncbi:unnamed protein product [Medioppia subpectinata]|uniref:Uncharacterized protein n=1 Tax=Medioppia subpectinata TaxID=1979941 RepID=A0A7R9Q7U7_9ACAR|nr:unnamed protein product [Medioppia subpectinata]CAG2116209.1 unnamed protein product [Medioppia subpectinata]
MEWNATTETTTADDSNEWSSVDAATLVSIGSSVVILVSGAVAVICLIVYMKRSEQFVTPSRLQCVKCGATVDTVVAPVVHPTTPALYAISARVDQHKDHVGLICGRVTSGATSRAIYAANPETRQQRSRQSLCSSNQTNDELIRVFARKQSFESLDDSSGRETPTDPGIREFTEAPPEANERRQGVVERKCFSSGSTTPTNEYDFGAIPRTRSRHPMWKLSTTSQTLKIGESLGLSDDDVDDDTQDDDFRRQRHHSIDC